MDIMRLMTYASPAVLIIGVCMGFYYYKTLNHVHKWITWYLLVMLLVDIASRIMGIIGNNLIVLLIYSLIELVLFMILYYKFLYKTKHVILKGLGALAIAYILYEIVIYWNIDVRNFQPYSKVADNFMVILLTLGFFQEKISAFGESKWDNFRFNIVVLVFFTLTMLVFLPVNFLVNESTGVKFYFWQGILVLTILFYLYLTASIWKDGRSKRIARNRER